MDFDSALVQQRLKALQNPETQNALSQSLFGLEREALRMGVDGYIAQTPHPSALGSTLTHPWITTDYSEALLEFITPPRLQISEALADLHQRQQFTYQHLGNESLWSASMPCRLPDDEQIPIAYYGESNSGKMKSIYRRGLGHRYGRTMQVIAGIHVNYSFSQAFWQQYQSLLGESGELQEFIDQHYFGLIRNLQRYGWLVSYLFGASPAVCTSFIKGHKAEKQLSRLGEDTYYEPFATSIRMGDIGYQNYQEGKTGIKACYNTVNSYVASLRRALNQRCPRYQDIGIKVDGDYRQLNDAVLQIENEYYSSVRPKQILEGDEQPIHALHNRGVRYIELRSVDINPYLPLGIAEEQLCFIETLLLFCLLQDSPLIDKTEQQAIDHNQSLVAHQGRSHGLKLRLADTETSLETWGLDLCDAMQGCAELLDSIEGRDMYQHSLKRQQQRLTHSTETYSAQILNEMRSEQESFFEFAYRYTQTHRTHFQTAPALSSANLDYFNQAAKQSDIDQSTIEQNETESFDDYLQAYFARR